VTQTTLDALAAGHKVYVVADGVSSCNREEVPVALARLRAEGAVVTTSESKFFWMEGEGMIFGLVRKRGLTLWHRFYI
jgi:hypothetical protein